uniref:Uncharacterized protein n=1 Tax=Heterorhabditis bacteriophora TaxID=37862 RepID=A0A1I7WJY8_HETBA
MKLGFEPHSVVASMSQFQLEQSSVIKTAPPGRQIEFSPKNEPLDLAPLTQSNLQDLSKMQPLDVYYNTANYQRAYETYATIGLGHTNQSPLIPAPSTASQLYYGFPNGVHFNLNISKTRFLGANRKMLHENRRDEKRRIQDKVFEVAGAINLTVTDIVPYIYIYIYIYNNRILYYYSIIIIIIIIITLLLLLLLLLLFIPFHI